MNILKWIIEFIKIRRRIAVATGNKLKLVLKESDLPIPMNGKASYFFIGEVRHLSELRRFVENEGLMAGLSRISAFELTTGVHELAMNALLYGKEGVVIVRRTDTVLAIQVIDNGPGIPLMNLLVPTIEEAKTHIETAGKGWFIALSFVDRVYLHTNSHGTTVLLVKDLPK